MNKKYNIPMELWGLSMAAFGILFLLEKLTTARPGALILEFSMLVICFICMISSFKGKKPNSGKSAQAGENGGAV